MNIDQVISALATVTLIEMMVTIGLGVALGDVLGVAMNRRLVVRAALANYVLVPAATMGLLLVLQAPPMVAVAFMIAAVCPGAPYGPPFTAMARGNVTLAVGLMVILAGSSAVVAPLLLTYLLPVVAGNEPLRLDPTRMVGALLATQLLPLCAGLFVRHRRPAVAARLRQPMARLSTALNLALLTVILAAQFRLLLDIRPIGYLAMLLLVAMNALAGWLLAGRGLDGRKTLALTTSVRNVGLCLVIVSSGFPGTAAVTATTAYGLFQTLVMALAAFAWGRWSPSETRPAAVAGLRPAGPAAERGS